MTLHDAPTADATLKTLGSLGLLSEKEIDVVTDFGKPSSRFHDTLALAETLHLHNQGGQYRRVAD